MDDSTMVMSRDLRICSRTWRTHDAKSGRSFGVFSIRAVRICSVTWTLLLSSREWLAAHGLQQPRGKRTGVLPYPLAINVAGCLLFEEAADFLDLGAARLGIEQQVAELARVRLDVDGALCCPRVAFQDEDLVLRATLLLERVHGGQRGLVLVRWCARTRAPKDGGLCQNDVPDSRFEVEIRDSRFEIRRSECHEIATARISYRRAPRYSCFSRDAALQHKESVVNRHRQPLVWETWFWASKNVMGEIGIGVWFGLTRGGAVRN